MCHWFSYQLQTQRWYHTSCKWSHMNLSTAVDGRATQSQSQATQAWSWHILMHVAKTWALNPDALGSVLTPSFLDVWPVAITFLRLNFYICKIGLMIVLASKSWGLNEVLHGKHSNTYPRTMFNTHLISIWGSDDWSQVQRYGLM